jgi:hypothetical protein
VQNGRSALWRVIFQLSEGADIALLMKIVHLIPLLLILLLNIAVI